MTNDEREELREARYTHRPLLEVYAHALEDLKAFQAVLAGDGDNSIEYWRLASWLCQDLRDIESHGDDNRSGSLERDIDSFIKEFNEMRATIPQLIDQLNDYV